jgi:hypothetical protein
LTARGYASSIESLTVPVSFESLGQSSVCAVMTSVTNTYATAGIKNRGLRCDSYRAEAPIEQHEKQVIVRCTRRWLAETFAGPGKSSP